MNKAIFVGEQESLSFPPEWHHEIAKRLEVLAGEFQRDEWHPSVPSETDVVFAT